MNAIFPELFFLSPFIAPVILRLVAALAFFLYAKKVWGLSKRRDLTVIKESVLGLFLLAGLFTQVIALLGVLAVLTRDWWLQENAPKQSWSEKIVLIGVLLTLVLTGAGAFAIDLPY